MDGMVMLQDTILRLLCGACSKPVCHLAIFAITTSSTRLILRLQSVAFTIAFTIAFTRRQIGAYLCSEKLKLALWHGRPQHNIR